VIDTVLGALGILVSVVFFIVGYRQTVGARKERISACNGEVERILLRRIVLESYAPARIDLDRLLDGKARDFRVRSDDLRSVAQVMNSLYTRIVESDVIPAQERKAILDRIGSALAESESQNSAEVETDATAGDLWNRTATAVLTMAGLASAMGALIAGVPDLLERSPFTLEVLKTPVLVATTSLVLISILLVVLRIRSSQEDTPTRSEEVDRYVRLETQVAATLRKNGYMVIPLPPDKAGDFAAERGGSKMIVEVKAWPRRVPSQVLSHLAERLKKTAEQLGATDIVLVTANPLVHIAEDFRLAGVNIVALRDLSGYLRQRGTAA
jgi:hypothetical protein